MVMTPTYHGLRCSDYKSVLGENSLGTALRNSDTCWLPCNVHKVLNGTPCFVLYLVGQEPWIASAAKQLGGCPWGED